MRVKCLAQEHNTMSPAKAGTRIAPSGDERTGHEATHGSMFWSKLGKVKILLRVMDLLSD